MVAERELWILGTDSLTHLIGKLEALKREHDKDPQQNYLFIHEHFEIAYPFKNFDRDETHEVQYVFASDILNDVIRLLNTRPKLAKYILIILGHEILEDENFVKLGFKTVFTWLLDEIQFAVLDRINSMHSKLGTVTKPEIIFAKITPKPDKMANSAFKASRRKVNKILETQLKEFTNLRFSFISVNEITSEARDYFHGNGSLNDSGNLAFWISISNAIKTKIQREQDSIKPIENSTQTEDSLLDDHIKIKAEKLAADWGYQNSRQTPYRYRNENPESYRGHYYNRDRPAHARSHSLDQGDRYHYYRSSNNRNYNN